jgi:hypothetical protein
MEFRTGAIKPIECVKEGWELIKADYWLLFAVTLVGGLIGAMTLYILLGGMVCGIYYVYMKRIDGGPVVFDDLWKGFSWWLPGLVVAAFIIVPMLFLYGILYFPLIMAAVMGNHLSESELWSIIGGAFVVDLVFIVIMVCFHTLILFAFPLIVDRKMGAFKAMLTSSKAVWKNLGGIAGLYAVNFVLSLAGGFACGVGIYFVIPIIFAGNLVAYRRIFPADANI